MSKYDPIYNKIEREILPRFEVSYELIQHRHDYRQWYVKCRYREGYMGWVMNVVVADCTSKEAAEAALRLFTS